MLNSFRSLNKAIESAVLSPYASRADVDQVCDEAAYLNLRGVCVAFSWCKCYWDKLSITNYLPRVVKELL